MPSPGSSTAKFRLGGSELEPFFEARSVALIGASQRADSLGAAVLDKLLEGAFQGPVHCVNPRHKRIKNRPCYARATDIPEPVDLAVIVTPAAAVPSVLEDCGAHGIGAAVVLSAGFRETGEQGRQLEQRALAAARRRGVRFIGPNCLGIMRPKIGLNASFSQTAALPGRIALVSQSGAVCTAMLDWARERRVGFSAVISSGIAADVDFGELLDYLALDPTTDAVMLYVEGIHDARRFMSALRSASRAKPVVVMKAGRRAEGSRAASSHTGALVGAADVFDAAIARAGAVSVGAYSEFLAVAQTLHMGLRTRGPRVALVTNGGGPGVIAADAAAERGLCLAMLSSASSERLRRSLPDAAASGNPVDVRGDTGPEPYAEAVEVCLTDPGVDAVLAIWVPTARGDAERTARLCADVAKAQPKAFLACWMGEAAVESSRRLFYARAIPSFGTPEEAVAALAAAEAHRVNQTMLLQVPETSAIGGPPNLAAARSLVASALGSGRRLLDAVESKALLAAFGIPVVESELARSAAGAVAAAARLGRPVAMKVLSRDITHKSDVGGIRLDLSKASEIEDAYEDIIGMASARCPDAVIEGVLVEPFWRPEHGREIMVGVVGDAVFGPVISVGLGGTLVEVIGDRSIALPPLNALLAKAMIEKTRAAKYLAAFRGWPEAEQGALEEVLLRVSDLAAELPEVSELDINPLVVDESGAQALDARVVVQRTQSGDRPYSHMAIHPFPSNLAGEHALADGTRIVIRPIRPEDAALERAFIEKLSQRSRYLRFMYTVKHATPEMIARFTQIDYDREMALVAIVRDADPTDQIGVARYVAHPNGQSSEFAIVIADAWQHRGLGSELLRRLIDVARQRGLRRMDGLALAENQGMLKLAEELGFSRRTATDDPGLVALSLAL